MSMASMAPQRAPQGASTRFSPAAGAHDTQRQASAAESVATGTTRERKAEQPEQTVKALYHVVGSSDPELLPRLLQPFAKLGVMPHRVHASTEDGDGSEMAVDLRLYGVPLARARQIERMLRATIGTRQVLAVIER